MKKLLIITSRFPFPVVGGDRLRIYQLCKKLSEQYELTLLSLCESKSEASLDVSADKVFKNIERIFMPKWRSYLNCLIAIPTITPLQVAYYRNAHFAKKVKYLTERHDLTFAHLIRTGDYLIDLPVPKILEMTDAISLNYKRVKEVAKSKGLKNFIYSFEQGRVEKYERQIIHNFDASLLVSKIDKNYLFPANCSASDKIYVISNGVDTDALAYNFAKESKTLVFIGNLYSIQNLDAALWFSREVMQTINPKYGLTFKVVGRIRASDKEKFRDFSNVIVTGEVDDVSFEACGALAGICSVRLGAGIQNKVLEYMALGIPCITTPIGLEGFSAKPNKDLLVAADVDEFKNQIYALINNQQKRAEIAQAGRRYVVGTHSWNTKLAPLIDIVESILEKEH